MSTKIARYLPLALVAGVVVFSFAAPAAAQGASLFDDLQLRLATGTNGDSFLEVLSSIINFILLIGGIIAFLFVLYGGFTYLTAGGDAGAAGKGRTMIVNAIIGIIIIFLSYTLVRFVVGRTSTRQSGSEVRF